MPRTASSDFGLRARDFTLDSPRATMQNPRTGLSDDTQSLIPDWIPLSTCLLNHPTTRSVSSQNHYQYLLDTFTSPTYILYLHLKIICWLGFFEAFFVESGIMGVRLKIPYNQRRFVVCGLWVVYISHDWFESLLLVGPRHV